MAVYYNENDPFAAAWLRELIKAGEIAPGDVDDRSIEDVKPNEIAGYDQCHFFAGIGVWSHALRRAGIPDDFPIWTGSCPCQPFSQAGKGEGFADVRHLWPAWNHLIEQCQPPVVLGEQVARKDGLGWLDLVQADLEGMGYACGPVVAPAAGFGAPHIRERLYWMAYADSWERGGLAVVQGPERDRQDSGRPQGIGGAAACSLTGNLAHADDARPQGRAGMPERAVEHAVGPGGLAGGMGDAAVQPREWDARGVSGAQAAEHGAGVSVDGRLPLGPQHASAGMGSDKPGPVNGWWRNADWIGCRDAKWRPVEPGTFPLVDGNANRMVRGGYRRTPVNANETSEARVMRLRGYGNALCAEQATAFCEAARDFIMET